MGYDITFSSDQLMMSIKGVCTYFFKATKDDDPPGEDSCFECDNIQCSIHPKTIKNIEDPLISIHCWKCMSEDRKDDTTGIWISMPYIEDIPKNKKPRKKKPTHKMSELELQIVDMIL